MSLRCPCGKLSCYHVICQVVMLYVTHTHTHISFFPDTPAFCLGTRSTPTILEQSLTDLSKLFSPVWPSVTHRGRLFLGGYRRNRFKGIWRMDLFPRSSGNISSIATVASSLWPKMVSSHTHVANTCSERGAKPFLKILLFL